MDGDRRQYEVRSPVGKGAFGTVYDARLLGEGGFSKRVALKVLRSDLDDAEEVAQRQRDEARILGLVRHRAVVHVDGLVQLSGRWVVVMEFIDGLDLNKVMRRHGRLPPSVALGIASEVAGALHVAYHTDGPDGRPLKLLHRDVKPGNITLTTAGEVKLLDFGVARADFDLREAETRSVRLGSMGYMSPERLGGEDRAAGDIYSLGVMLWECLVGVRFGQTQLVRNKQEARVREQLEALMAKVPSLPPGVRGLLEDMLAFDPNDRPNGREVERRCAELFREVEGPLLRDWCEREISRLQEGRKIPDDDEGLTGQLLVEGEHLAQDPDSLLSNGVGPRESHLARNLAIAAVVLLVLGVIGVLVFVIIVLVVLLALQ